MENSIYGPYDTSNDKTVFLRKATDNQYSNDVRLGGMLNLSLRPRDNRHYFEWKNIFNQIAKGRYSERTGFNGTVQYGLSIRDPRIADTSQSNGFESDNNASGAETTPFTSAVFKNMTFIGPKAAKNTDFENTPDYITAGSVFPDNGSKLGKFQSAMQIRRSSKLNGENILAVGYPIGLIVDGEKGSTVQYAQNGDFHLKNIIFAGMGVLGTDKNKEYEDYLYDYATGTEDRTKESFSHSFFLSEPTNKVMEEAELSLTDPMKTGQNYCPSTTLSDGNGGYIGAFKDANDNWLEGWTNFDPQNTNY